MEKIIEARSAARRSASLTRGYRIDRCDGGLMQYVEPEDLQRYGIIPELVGDCPSGAPDELD